jgi:hypothetical protein
LPSEQRCLRRVLSVGRCNRPIASQRSLISHTHNDVQHQMCCRLSMVCGERSALNLPPYVKDIHLVLVRKIRESPNVGDAAYGIS